MLKPDQVVLKNFLNPRIEWWQNTNGKINYRLIGKNGETLYATVQGFERKAGMQKNIDAVISCFVVTDSFVLPQIKVKPPHATKKKK